MRKLSSNNFSRSLKRILLAFVLCLALFARAEETYFDDEALSDAFTEKCAQLIESEQHTEGSEIRRVLRQEPKLEAPLPGRDEVDGETPEREIIRRARKATVILGHLYLCDKCTKWHNNLAGGVVISRDGLVVTNYHVLNFAKAKTFAAMTSDGTLYPVGEVIASSKKDDLAIIRLVEAEGLSHVTVAGSSQTGDEVFVISHPDSHFFTFTRGHVSRHFLTPKSKAKRIQITAPFARGSSGSGIFNQYGEIVGLATFTNTINYEEKTGKNPQMVLYTGASAVSILKLAAPGP